MAGTFVLKPYVRRRETSRFGRFMLFVAIMFLAAFYGLMCSVLPMRMLAIPTVPVLVMIAIVLWMMPDIGAVRVERIQSLLLWFIGLNIVWPNYVAFDLPGLPWITPTRLVVFALLAVVVFGVATSAELRAKIADSHRSVPILHKLFWGFWLLTTISIVFSRQPVASINKYANNQIFWTMMFLLATYLATREDYVTKMSRILVATLFFVAMLGIYEYYIQRVFWIDKLPGFLRVDPEFIERVAKAQSRAGTDVYRVRGTLATSLYFAEYLAMVFPLALHLTVMSKSFRKFVLLALGVAGTMVVMYLTNARSAMVGMLLTFTIYPFFYAWRRREQKPNSVGAMTTLMSYPFAVVAVAMLVIFWHRAHVLILGGGQHAASSEARDVQWAMGMPKVITHPFGHGVSQSATVLGYANGAGELTIDTYYLSALLDYGFIALPVFILLFALPGWYGFRSYSIARTRESQLVAPLAIGLINFTVIKSVLSSEGNFPLAFIMLGCVIGLIWRQKQAAAQPAGLGATGVPAPA